ncbi:ABC transporter ATP-binding protein [Lentilactobacillus hilgardii]|uniref:ABC transporter, ATP-binding protein n=1 Tax=Lentilactobacillus hilgardii (strain ATCC 8290 / DSM 20176 / CCUG 30140 / JCM 1155 / KCTC 3500 / NBRC 15886 / NCIMB 8040 / NRRL B-1843 / 9) TaxID=1423757 RepID=C0XIB8_LENH9|nr:ABC transporter ATP-binding protein [Lentilactobacillus hilgardii]EEI20879.1 ABC transporter, ATP-binding protein [Lentilactobacillus buchneri ATCC 11577]EEI24902.1 ABC transporter, ATP-binding protein [Lentilactobacillus hilgardii DSM 20176 = ATCC 8290]KRK53855.1 ABC superfamily ATP binding cassette transporter ATPase [Lentilactobacillus hilgardii DSM 20176 = ATCC 8290]MCP9332425.1 ABC transporter ATP-binding protein [Lentilactobacillus hilgardii]MCP9348935.1 ABC transporter ATP-binding pr
MTNSIEIKNLNYRKNMKPILSNVNLTIASGKIVGLLGENGAGKTTLMRLIAGVAKGYQGQISVVDESKIAAKKAIVSFSEQLSGFNQNMKIERIVRFYEDVYPDFSEDKYNQMAGFLQINEDQKLSQLSKGMREKLIIGLALSRRAKVYLLDEPFGGIDSMSRKKIINSIIRWKPDNATILISDHYVSEIASVLDEIVIIKDKTVFAQKSTEEIREKFGEGIEEYYEKVYEGTELHD